MIPLALPSKPHSALARQLRVIYDRAEQFPLSVLQALARLAVGAVFFKSGLTKIANWDLTVMLFADEYAVPLLSPEIAAALATTAELVCPALLVLGLAARLATLPLLAMTFVIQAFVYPENWAEHLTWTTLLLLILARGAGLMSIDHLVRTALGR